MTIIEELRQNRESGARRLEAEYKAGLMALARRFCADESDAEELVNSTFATVVENIDDYLEQSAFFAWMCQILTRTHAMSVRRKANRMIDYTGDVPDILDETGPEAIYGNLDASLMREAIGLLPDDQREIIVLRYFMDMPIAKIAKFLAIPSGTVRSRLHYARAALAAKLGAAAKKPGVKALLVVLALGAVVAVVSGALGDRALPVGADRRAARTEEFGADEPSALRQSEDEPSALRQDAPQSRTEGPEETSVLGAASVSPVPPALSFIKSLSPIPSTQAETTMNTTQLLAGPLAALALAAPTANLADNPSSDTIAYWPFGNSGFADVSGNGHDLASTTVTESDAGYITLNGTSQFLTTAQALDLSGETAVTFECWTRSTGKNSSFGVLFSAPSPAGTKAGSFVLYYTGRLQSQFGMGTGWQLDYTASQTAMDDGTWHHVAYVIDRTQTGENATRLYLDGVQMQNAGGQTGTVPALLNDVLHIGGGSSYVPGNDFFTGYIDDVRISRGALTPDQFLKYPSVGKAMRADTNALPVLAYWPFGGKGGKDATGNGFDLTMNGVPMTSGTPSPSYSNYARTNCCAKAFPLSAFSKTGLTIEMFVKTDSSGGGMVGQLIESSGGYYSTPGAFLLRYNNDSYDTVSASFLTSNSGGEKYAGSATDTATFGDLSDNKWRHFAMVYDPSKTGPGIVTLYVDGVAAPCTATDEAQKAFALADTGIYLTRRSYGTNRGNTFYGSIDDVRITGCALTPDQFLTSRSAASTVALYRFDQESLIDQTGNGNTLVNEGNATFGVGADAASGTGIVLNGTDQWIHTLNGIDLTHTKAATVEFDYYSGWPGGSKYWVFCASHDVSLAGAFTLYNPSSSIQAQLRTATGASTWRIDKGDFTGGNGHHIGQYVIAGSASPQTALYIDGVKAGVSQNNTATFDNLGNQVLHFGHAPNYGADMWLNGKFMRIAISDVALDSADFVLDNLIDPEAKSTLAYWSFAGDVGLSPAGAPRRNGALDLDGSSSVTTTNLTLSTLTQATIECFVCFGTEPSSGTLFSMGTGAGSFAVAADATAGTLFGSFVPYDHLAAANGGATALAPLAGKKVWHHVALVIDRTNPGADAVRFYVDYERTTPAGRAWDAAAAMLDGSISIGDGFTGWIDDLRVSAGALEPSEFLQPGMRTETPDAFTIVIR